MALVVVVVCCLVLISLYFSMIGKKSHNNAHDFMGNEASYIKYEYRRNGSIIELWEKDIRKDDAFIHTGSIDVAINLILPLGKKAKTTTLARLLKISHSISNGTFINNKKGI